MLERVFYVSRVAVDLGALGVQRILASSTIRNRRLDVTGALTRSGDYFAQVLEGRTEAIDELLASLARDPRHSGVRILLRVPIIQRDYAEWSMGWVEAIDAGETLHQLFEREFVDAQACDAQVRRLFKGL